MLTFVPDSGAYQSDAVIANAQRCINYYPERNPQETKPPAPTTHYQRPGKRILGTPVNPGAGRGLYRATNGALFAVVGQVLYYVNPVWQFTIVGNLVATSTNPVSMADNGQNAGDALVLVDGSNTGYEVTLSTFAFAPIVDGTGSFQGADIAIYTQTFFLFNVPGTQNWIISQPDSVTFNPLDIAAKASYADTLQTIGMRQREPWLIGTLTTEPWSLTGAADFPFEEVPSAFVPYGCIAKYSVVSADVSLFWVSQNQQGKAIIVKSEGYEAKRISTHAIETMIQGFTDISDCIGGTYQVGGHTFVAFHFPTGNMSMVYDLATQQWHEECWTDANGNLNRDRAAFYANAYGQDVGLDWENGTLYALDPAVFNDYGGPVTYIRGFPHVLDQMRRVTHWQVVVDIECGTIADQEADPQLNLRYSDDRGASFGDWMQTSLGKTGETLTSPQFNNLGMARDRVYEIMHSADAKAPLNGIYVEPEGAES